MGGRRRPREIDAEDRMAQWVWLEMLDLGWSYGGLAAAMRTHGCDISRSSLYKALMPHPNSKGEYVRRPIRVDELIALSRVFKVDPGFLAAGGAWSHQRKAQEAQARLAQSDTALFRVIQRMIDDQLEWLSAIGVDSPDLRHEIAVRGNQTWLENVPQ